MSDLDKLIEGLSPRQRELLMRRLGAARPGGEAPARIPLRGTDAPAPLSFAQERMWFLEQLDPGRATYNLFNGLRIRGPLDAALLQRCLGEVAARHEVLRTVFREQDGRLVQQAALPPQVELPVEDLRNFPAAAREGEVLRRAAAEYERPFDLAVGPPWRAGLLVLGPHEHALFVTLHHIVADGWSMGLLVNEVAELYRAARAGRPARLPVLPLQYADFAAWQRGWLASRLDEQVEYWKHALGGRLPQLRLPADRSRSAAAGARAGLQTLALSQELTAALLALARAEGATLFMLLLAALDVLLQRLTGESDVLVGCPVANRNRAELEALVGCFLNTLALRVDLSGDPTFRTLLGRVREATLAAYAHQDVPLEMVLKTLPGEVQRAPFQVMFLLQNYPSADLAFGELTASPIEAEARIDLDPAAVDLTLAAEERGGDLTVWATYNEGLFEAGTVRRLLRQFRSLLEGALEDPARRVSEYALLEEDERGRLAEWARGGPAPAAEPVHTAFERRARLAPSAVAVKHEERELSYDALNRRANRLARRLRALGLGPDVRAGIFLERSPEMLVAVLGVLKAGGAYLPLDPATPVERLRVVLADAGAALVVTSGALRAGLPETAGRVVCLDDAAEERTLAALDDADPGLPVEPESLAYVIYTSGSTGRPKGVMVGHAALAAYTETARAEYALTARDRVLQFASLSFDTSAEEIYPCWAAGATLVLRTPAMLSSAAEFLERCRAWGVSVLDLPTAWWHELVERLREAPVALPPALRLVILGGEKALGERLAAWQALFGENGPLLVNTYGPTEATIVATLWRPPAGAWPESREVPIGRPVRGARAHVLDARLEPAPIGVPGELCLGGAGLARGYLGSPGLTAERFVPDPLDARPGARLYRTGDLARWLSDGTLEFLGRADRQVKVRGFRVELGEVEGALQAHPAVEQAVVAAREDRPGDRRLVAYVVTRGADGAESALLELRGFLEALLPDYMVPARFVRLERLPLNPSGKVDRAALPAPDPGAAAGGRAYVAPGTPIEEKLAAIFARVLGLERVGVHDDFFHVGGHSLLLPQVLHQVLKTFDVQVPLRALMEEPTVAELALTVEELLLDQIEALSGGTGASEEA